MRSLNSTLSAFIGCCLLVCGSVQANDNKVFGLVKFFAADLKASPQMQGEVLVTVPAGEMTEYLESSGPFWWKVRWKGQEGWLLRALLEKVTQQELAEAQLARDSDNDPSPRKVVIAPIPPGTGRALLMGISTYAPASGVPPLPGVPVDMVSATSMAQMMGISADRVSIHRDQALSKNAVSALLTQLGNEVTSEEPVLIYYSGHGGRVGDPASPGRCIEGLITHEGQLFTATEMADLLRPIANKTSNLFVFVDACHSGGLSTTRAVGDPYLRPKFFAKSGAASNCSDIVNMLSQPAGSRSTGNRWIYAGAARPDEISLDDARTGGLATSNWLQCMAKADNSSSVEQLRLCTQSAINERVQGSKIYKPQNLTFTGDQSIAPMRANLSTEVKLGLASNSFLPVQQTAGETAKAAFLKKGLVAKGIRVPSNIDEAVSNILAGGKKGVGLVVQVPSQVRINGAPLSGTVSVKKDSFLYIFYRSADRKGLTLLFPNALDRNNFVTAGTPFSLPRADWPLVASGPEGVGQLLIVSSQYPRDLNQLVGGMNDPFFEVSQSPLGGQAFSLGMSRAAFEEDEPCNKASRSPNANPWCASTYEAYLQQIKETR